MTLFDAVKDGVTTRQAAERYGLQVGRQGMCKCPFHNDRNPSMKVDKRFHCFGCQADGDVINFTARLFGLSPQRCSGTEQEQRRHDRFQRVKLKKDE